MFNLGSVPSSWDLSKKVKVEVVGGRKDPEKGTPKHGGKNGQVVIPGSSKYAKFLPFGCCFLVNFGTHFTHLGGIRRRPLRKGESGEVFSESLNCRDFSKCSHNFIISIMNGNHWGGLNLMLTCMAILRDKPEKMAHEVWFGNSA